MSIARDTGDNGYFPPYRKNLIINGDFRVWQRGTLETAQTASFILADRWRQSITGVGGGAMTAQQMTTLPTGMVGKGLIITVTTADTSLGTTDFYGISYRIEGYDTQPLAYGTTGAKSFTLSFWVWATLSGTYCIGLRNDTFDRYHVVEYEIASGSTWELITITIPGDTTGTWNVDNDIGLELYWGLGLGTNYEADPDEWATGNKLVTTNQTNVMASTNNQFALKEVQLEVGSIATDFEYRSIANEVDMCQRYYEKSYEHDDPPGTANKNGAIRVKIIDTGTRVYGLEETFRTTKRGTPTITWYSSNNGVADRVYNVNNASNDTIDTERNEGHGSTGYPQLTTSQDVTDRMEAHWTADSEL